MYPHDLSYKQLNEMRLKLMSGIYIKINLPNLIPFLPDEYNPYIT